MPVDPNLGLPGSRVDAHSDAETWTVRGSVTLAHSTLPPVVQGFLFPRTRAFVNVTVIRSDQASSAVLARVRILHITTTSGDVGTPLTAWCAFGAMFVTSVKVQSDTSRMYLEFATDTDDSVAATWSMDASDVEIVGGRLDGIIESLADLTTRVKGLEMRAHGHPPTVATTP